MTFIKIRENQARLDIRNLKIIVNIDGCVGCSLKSSNQLEIYSEVLIYDMILCLRFTLKYFSKKTVREGERIDDA